MNTGDPCTSIDPQTTVLFRASEEPLDKLVKDWLSDNPKYHEVSLNKPLRIATFRNFGGIIKIPSSRPHMDLLGLNS